MWGLAIGLIFVYPKNIKPGLNAGLLVRLRYILEYCKIVKEAISELQRLPIASNQTLTLADKTGNLVAIECNSEKIIEIKPGQKEQFVATDNNFNFEHNEIF